MSDTLEVAATGAAADAICARVPGLVEAGFAGRLFGQDPTLWGTDAESEAAIRLSCVGLPRSSRPLLGEIAALRGALAERGIDHVVLCGMGGSSLAPEVICADSGVELTVLDSAQPDQVRAALADRLERTVVVVSSKSGSTVQTDSQRRAYQAAFEAAGLDPTERMVIVTDPGSPLDQQARERGFRVVNADPHVGGRYSALTASGLVPSGLAGADIAELLDDAEAVADLLAADDDANPALRLGAAIGGTNPLRDKLVLLDDGSGLAGFAGWAERLIAESTGKHGTGLLPVVAEAASAPKVALPPPDVTVVHLAAAPGRSRGTDQEAGRASLQTSGSDVIVSGRLGAQLLLWETATATACRLLGINPFDQPDVESAQHVARQMLTGTPGRTSPDLVDGPIQIRALGGDWLDGAMGTWLQGMTNVSEAVDALLGRLDRSNGYVAVMAYLDRVAWGSLAHVRGTLARRVRRPVTFGWGPRFLHSTGHFHKGGLDVGVYIQITAEPTRDLLVPGQDYTFGTLVAARAAGDARVLDMHGRPVLQLHLTDPTAGVPLVLKALS